MDKNTLYHFKYLFICLLTKRNDCFYKKKIKVFLSKLNKKIDKMLDFRNLTSKGFLIKSTFLKSS